MNVKETSKVVKSQINEMVIHILMISLQSFSFHTKMFLSPSVLIQLISVNMLVHLYVCIRFNH